MKRLTTRAEDGHAIPVEMIGKEPGYVGDGIEVVEKLAAYEDAEEQGRLILLPVAKGSTVYYVPDYLYGRDSLIDELTVMGYRMFEDESIYLQVMRRYLGPLINIKRIGKDIFLTREEAETKLKEMETDNE